MTNEAPAMTETLLDAPTDNTTGDGVEADKTLLDTKGPDKAESKETKADVKPTEPEDKKAEPGNADKKPDTKVVPEKYADPKVSENTVLDPEIKLKVEALAKEVGMTQESFQKVFDLYDEVVQKNVAEMKKMTDGWAEETKKELGSDYQKTLALASKAIDLALTDPKDNKDFRDLMSITGLGNNRLLAKVLIHYGKTISEDKFVEGGSKPVNAEKTIAQKLYPDLPSEVSVNK